MQPGAVVPADVLRDCSACSSTGRPRPGVDELALERGEEALAQGVIPALPGPPDGQGDLVLFGEGGVGRGSVLGDVIGVEDHARLGAV